MFGGFKAISANFTPAPNQFFDEVLGHYPCRVVTVVGILIRNILGWEDPDTGDRRIEAELPLSSFIRPDLCENSARRGLAEAIAAGLIVRTVSASSREGARYALRWADGAALERALEKSRRIHGTEDPVARWPANGRGPKNASLDGAVRGAHFGGPKNVHPYINKTKNLIPRKKRNIELTLNVRDQSNPVVGEGKMSDDQSNRPSSNRFDAGLSNAAGRIVEELRDWGSCATGGAARLGERTAAPAARLGLRAARLVPPRRRGARRDPAAAGQGAEARRFREARRLLPERPYSASGKEPCLRADHGRRRRRGGQAACPAEPGPGGMRLPLPPKRWTPPVRRCTLVISR